MLYICYYNIPSKIYYILTNIYYYDILCIDKAGHDLACFIVKIIRILKGVIGWQ